MQNFRRSFTKTENLIVNAEGGYGNKGLLEVADWMEANGHDKDRQTRARAMQAKRDQGLKVIGPTVLTIPAW